MLMITTMEKKTDLDKKNQTKQKKFALI